MSGFHFSCLAGFILTDLVYCHSSLSTFKFTLFFGSVLELEDWTIKICGFYFCWYRCFNIHTTFFKSFFSFSSDCLLCLWTTHLHVFLPWMMIWVNFPANSLLIYSWEYIYLITIWNISKAIVVSFSNVSFYRKSFPYFISSYIVCVCHNTKTWTQALIKLNRNSNTELHPWSLSLFILSYPSLLLIQSCRPWICGPPALTTQVDEITDLHCQTWLHHIFKHKFS